MNLVIHFLLIGLVTCFSLGCYHPGMGPRVHALSRHRGQALQKPVVAVIDFENRSGFSGQWKLGRGMADVLTTHLIDSDRVTVLERQYIHHVVEEIEHQQHRLFRKEGQVERGRLKNARYLIRGVVTDFTVTGDVSGWFGTEKGRGKARSSRARVAINLMISEVESGEIIQFGKKLRNFERRGGFGGNTRYQGIQFGGDAFFRKPTRSRYRPWPSAALFVNCWADIPMQPLGTMCSGRPGRSDHCELEDATLALDGRQFILFSVILRTLPIR